MSKKVEVNKAAPKNSTKLEDSIKSINESKTKSGTQSPKIKASTNKVIKKTEKDISSK